MAPILLVTYICEALPVAVGFLCWKKVKETHYKWFVLYLLYIFCADVLGLAIILNGKLNEHYYDYLVIPVEFLFFFWLFHVTFRGRIYARVPLICTVVYVAGFIADAAWLAGQRLPFYSLSYTVGNLLLLVLILLFFIQLMNSDAVLAYRQNMMFWICAGLLVYYLGSCPYFGLKNTFAYKYKHANILYNYVVLVLDCVMYLMFSISFIWAKPNLRSL